MKQELNTIFSQLLRDNLKKSRKKRKQGVNLRIPQQVFSIYGTDQDQFCSTLVPSSWSWSTPTLGFLRVCDSFKLSTDPANLKPHFFVSRSHQRGAVLSLGRESALLHIWPVLPAFQGRSCTLSIFIRYVTWVWPRRVLVCPPRVVPDLGRAFPAPPEIPAAAGMRPAIPGSCRFRVKHPV